MIAATAIASIGAFVVAFWLLRIARVGSGVLAVAKSALSAIRDTALDDAAREKIVQRASLRLMGAFVSILLRSLLALLAAFIPIWVTEAMGLAASEDVLQYLSRWDVIAVASLVIISGYVVWVRMQSSK